MKSNSCQRATKVQKHHEKTNLWLVIDDKTLNNTGHILPPSCPSLSFRGSGLRALHACASQIMGCVTLLVGPVFPSFTTRVCVLLVTHSSGSQRVWFNLHFHLRPAVKKLSASQVLWNTTRHSHICFFPWTSLAFICQRRLSHHSWASGSCCFPDWL